MNSRLAAWFAAVVLLVLGAWLSWEGWLHKKLTTTKGIAFRAAGVAALAAGGYSMATAARR